MKKEDLNKSRYCLQYDDHAKVISNVLCSMMEHQSLVDLAIRCGNNTIHVHKCVLAANSNYFKDQLEKNGDTEQIVVNGLDFGVVKALIEFMYCGETNILEDNLKYFIAAAKFFQMRGIQSMAQDNSQFNSDDVSPIPAPTFLSKKPKYSNTYLPFNNPNVTNGIERNILQNDPSYHRRLKRKYMRTEAEKACAKEAAASRLALEALQKELANTSQVSSFVIEESCTETTVENFIPHSDDTYIDNLGHLSNVPLQVVNYSELNPSVLSTANQMINPKNTVGHYEMGGSDQEIMDPTTEKLKHILGTDNLPNNVEIMFKTSEGNFVSVTEEVLANITRGSLQYQLVDENGHAGELQEVRVSDKIPIMEQPPLPNNDVIDTSVNSFIVNSDNDSLMKKTVPEQPDANIFIPMNNPIADKMSSIANDDYEGMIQECTNPEGFPTEVFIKHSDMEKKLNALNTKEPTFSTRQFEVFEEDSSSVYISNCDPLSEACGIAEKDESDKLKQCEQSNIRKLSPKDGYINLSENMLTTEMYGENKDDNIDCKLPLKKFKLGKSFIDMASEQCDDSKPIDFSPRKTRSFKQLPMESNVDVDSQNVNKFFDGCMDKTKKLLPIRKKK